MDYIYIDESGDLGTKKGSSKYFVMTAIKVEDSKKLDKIINKIRRVAINKKIKMGNEIKGSSLPFITKKRIFKKLNKIDYKVYSIVFNKNFIYKLESKNNNELYNVLACELAKIIEIEDYTFIFIDKSKNKKREIIEFNDKFLGSIKKYKKYPIAIEHVNSINYKGLQIADIISWSIFHNFEHDNDEFITLINNKHLKIVFED